MFGHPTTSSNTEIGDERKQQPIKQSCLVSLRRDLHLKSLLLTLLVFGCLSAITWCRVTVVTHFVVYYDRYASHRSLETSSPCADGYIYIPVAFVILLYLVYLVECWHCHTRLELKHKVDVQTAYHKMRQMREALPIIWWKALCYHYVRRTRQVTRYRNGDAFTSTQVYYERINSHTAGCAFNFTNCGFKDMTKVVVGLEDYAATKIRFSKSFSFLHPDSKYEYDDQRNQFFLENERRDDYMETREGMDLLNVNFKEYMIAFKDPDNLPWYVSNVVFWICSFLLLSWPLRVIIEYKTAYIHYHVHKVFGTNYVSAEEVPDRRVPRVNTIESIDLERIVRNNFTVVPSYSEALLMNENATSTRTLHDANANITSPVLGPTRSVTFHNISQSNSSGYISGFFSSTNFPNPFQSSATQPINVMSTPTTRKSFHSSLRNMLKSPWSRRRKSPASAKRSNTMFLLSSPESADEFSLTTDQRLLSVHGTRNYSSFNDIHSQDALGKYCAQSCERSNGQCSPSPDGGVSGSSNPMSERDNVPLCSTMQTINENSSPSKTILGASLDRDIDQTMYPKRPNSFFVQKNEMSGDFNNKTPKPIFINSNLPKVPVNNILPESCSDIPSVIYTPSSPPCYEAALFMQIPDIPQGHEPTVTGTTEARNNSTSNSGGRSNQYTMMETCL